MIIVTHSQDEDIAPDYELLRARRNASEEKPSGNELVDFLNVMDGWI
ncbi:MAG: hypothetical protein WC314_12005 [Vulcanimicrobiota bacterium]